MQIDRKTAYAPRVQALAASCANLPVACVGCEGCQGICAALIDAMTLPELILKESS